MLPTGVEEMIIVILYLMSEKGGFMGFSGSR
jgi:hypothetical protein